MANVKTADMYESAYYLLNGCEIEAIEGRNFNGRLLCDLTFSGESIEELQREYFQGRANVDLLSFRRSYTRLMNCLSDAKKKLKREMGEGGEE